MTKVKEATEAKSTTIKVEDMPAGIHPPQTQTPLTSNVPPLFSEGGAKNMSTVFTLAIEHIRKSDPFDENVLITLIQMKNEYLTQLSTTLKE